MGQGGRRFPLQMNATTTPRLVAAKRKAIEVMAMNDYAVLRASYAGVLFVIGLVAGMVRVGELLVQGFRATRAAIPRTAAPKPVQDAVQAGAAEAPAAAEAVAEAQVYTHMVNKGGLEDIIQNQRLVATEARGIAGGNSAVRAYVGPARGAAGDKVVIEFTTAVKGNPRPFIGGNGMEWPMPEGEYLPIKILKIYYPGGQVVAY
jgi:hypothetical protein